MSRSQSALECTFAYYMRILGGEEPPASQHRFYDSRKWQFDFAWPALRVAVEVEGGVWTKGRHIRPEGFMDDCEKYNAAAADGWLVLRIPGPWLSDDPAGVVALVQQTLALREVEVAHV